MSTSVAVTALERSARLFPQDSQSDVSTVALPVNLRLPFLACTCGMLLKTVKPSEGSVRMDGRSTHNRPVVELGCAGPPRLDQSLRHWACALAPESKRGAGRLRMQQQTPKFTALPLPNSPHHDRGGAFLAVSGLFCFCRAAASFSRRPPRTHSASQKPNHMMPRPDRGWGFE